MVKKEEDPLKVVAKYESSRMKEVVEQKLMLKSEFLKICDLCASGLTVTVACRRYGYTNNQFYEFLNKNRDNKIISDYYDKTLTAKAPYYQACAEEVLLDLRSEKLSAISARLLFEGYMKLAAVSDRRFTEKESTIIDNRQINIQAPDMSKIKEFRRKLLGKEKREDEDGIIDASFEEVPKIKRGRGRPPKNFGVIGAPDPKDYKSVAKEGKDNGTEN